MAAIAADNAKAAVAYDEGDDFAQNESGVVMQESQPTIQAHTLATVDSENAVQSEGELDSWSEADLDLDSEASADLELEGESDLDDIDDDFDLAQTCIDADADADGERCCCPCMRRRARILAHRRRIAQARAARIRRVVWHRARRI